MVSSEYDIYVALRKHRRVEVPMTWDESELVAEVDWDAQRDSERSRSRSDITRDTTSIESSRQAQSCSKARDLICTSRFNMLAHPAPTCPTFPAVQKLLWTTPQVNSVEDPYPRRSKKSKDLGNIERPRQVQSSSERRRVAPTNDIDMPASSASTCSSVPAVQTNSSVSNDTGYISPPYNSESDISNSIRSINNFCQAHASAEKVAPMNDTGMLADPGPTCSSVPAVQSLNRSASHDTSYIAAPYSSESDISNSLRGRDSSPTPTSPKGPALQSLNWSASHDTGYISPPYSSGSDILHSPTCINSSGQAQGYSNARDLANTNDFDMLAASATTETNSQASEEMEWSVDSNISKIAQVNWNGGGSQLARSAWEATNFGYANDYDMLVDLPPSSDAGRLNGYYNQWLIARSTYP